MSKPQVMLVDDEPNVLSAIKRTIGRHYSLDLCVGGEDALAKIRQGARPPVVITDMRMPGMSGVEFVRAARKLIRDSMFIMLTGNADQQTAIDAINEGQVFRFLNKPCDSQVLEKTIQASLRQHQLITAERTLLRETLAGSTKLLMEAAACSSPDLERLTADVRETVRRLSGHLLGEVPWSISVASSLFAIGFVTLPRTDAQVILDDSVLNRVAESGAKLLRHIPRLETVASMIRQQRSFIIMADPLDPSKESHTEALGASLLRFAVDHNRFLTRVREHGTDGAAREMLEQSHDRRILSAARAVLADWDLASDQEHPSLRLELSPRELRIGDRLCVAAQTKDGVLLLPARQELSAFMIERLRNFARAGLLESQVITIERAGSKDAGQQADAAAA